LINLISIAIATLKLIKAGAELGTAQPQLVRVLFHFEGGGVVGG